jgi:O-antigen ligase
MKARLIKVMLGLSVAIAFLIPIWKFFLPLIAGLLFVAYIISGDWKSRLLMLKRSAPMLALLSFYCYNVIGLIWTQNMDKGWLHLEIKMALLLFPFIIFARPDLNSAHIKFIRRAFVIGSILSAFTLIIRASYLFFSLGENHFSYELFSPYFHPSYMAMYFLMAAFMLYEEFRISRKPISRIFPLGILILVCSTVLLSSKINLLILALSMAFLFIYNLRKAEKKFPIIMGIVLAVIISIGLVICVPSITDRFTKAIEVIRSENPIDRNDTESTAARLLVWESALEILKENPMGVGVGDVNIELTKQYHVNHFSGIEAKQLNAHNQFLQTAVALGYPGLIALILVFFLPLREGILQNNRCLVFFIALCFVNALVEGILETQNGILFFAFFYSIFQRNYEHE